MVARTTGLIQATVYILCKILYNVVMMHSVKNRKKINLLFISSKYKDSYCSHPGHLLVCACACLLHSRHTVFKFFKCLYLNSHLPQTIHI